MAVFNTNVTVLLFLLAIRAQCSSLNHRSGKYILDTEGVIYVLVVIKENVQILLIVLNLAYHNVF